MKKIALGSLLSAVAMFIWGFLFWGIFEGFGSVGVLELPHEEIVSQTLKEYIPESGMYYLPGANPEDTERLETAHQEGPIAMIFFHREGTAMMSPALMLQGFFHMFLVSFLIAYLLQQVLPVFGNSYPDRVKFVLLVGFLAAFWIDLSLPIWWHNPWTFHVLNLVYHTLSWLLAGLILGRFIRN